MHLCSCRLSSTTTHVIVGSRRGQDQARPAHRLCSECRLSGCYGCYGLPERFVCHAFSGPPEQSVCHAFSGSSYRISFTVCIVLEVQGVADVNPLVSFLKAPKLRGTLCYVSEAKEHTLRIPKLRSRRCQVSEAKGQSLSASQSLRVVRLSRIQVARSRVL